MSAPGVPAERGSRERRGGFRRSAPGGGAALAAILILGASQPALGSLPAGGVRGASARAGGGAAAGTARGMLPRVVRGGSPGPARAALAAEAPLVTGITPAQGSTEGRNFMLTTEEEAVLGPPGNTPGTAVSISGERLEGARAVLFGGVPAAWFSVVGANAISAYVPAHEAGSVGVCVERSAAEGCTPGVNEISGAYTYGPVVERVTPDEGAWAGGTKVTVEGRGFEGVSEVALAGLAIHDNPARGGSEHAAQECEGGPHVTEAFKASPGKIEFTTQSSSGCAAGGISPFKGAYDVTVKSNYGRSATGPADRFTFGPRVEAVHGRFGPIAGGATVTIEGHGFERCSESAKSSLSECPLAGERTPIVEAVSFGSATAAGFSVLSPEVIEVTTPAHAAGPVAVSVKTEGGRNLAAETGEAGQYTFGSSVTSLSRHAGPLAGADTLTIKGEGLGSATAVRFAGEATSAEATPSATSPEQITVTVPAMPASHPQLVHVEVITPEVPGGTEAGEAALYAYGLPFVEKVEPDFGSTEEGKAVKILGRNLAGFSGVELDGTELHHVPVASARALRLCGAGPCSAQDELEVTMPSVYFNAGGGSADVVVDGASGGNSPRVETFDGFWFGGEGQLRPVVEHVEAAEGRIAGGTKVRIRGQNFVSGGTRVYFGEEPAGATVLGPTAFRSKPNELIATVPPHEVCRAAAASALSSCPAPGERVLAAGSVPIEVVTPEGASQLGGADANYRYEPFEVAPGGLQAGPCLALTCSFQSADPLSEYFTQASAEAPYFVIGVGFNSPTVTAPFISTQVSPVAPLKDLRLDFPPGLTFNPRAIPSCAASVVAKRWTSCPEGSVVGTMLLRAYFTVEGRSIEESTPVINVEPAPGQPAEFAVQTPVLGTVWMEGGLSWHSEAIGGAGPPPSGDYHEYATIREAPDTVEPLVETRLIFNAQHAASDFVTTPGECRSSLTYHVVADSYGEGEVSKRAGEAAGSGLVRQGAIAESASAAAGSPAGIAGCSNVPFEPTVLVRPENAVSDHAAGVTVEVQNPHAPGANPEAAIPRTIAVTLPEGMTLDPTAVRSLVACSDAQFGVREEEGRLITQGSGVMKQELQSSVEVPPGAPACPEGSKVGSFAVVSPDLPELICRANEAAVSVAELKTLAQCPGEAERKQTLEGSVYIAAPRSSEPGSGNEYRIFLDAESKRYGLSIRLLGHIAADPVTGRLTTTIETPQVPFSKSTLSFMGGPGSPLANPLVCGQARSKGLLVPYGETQGGKVFPEPVRSVSDFNVEGCASPMAFAPLQSAQMSTTQAGASPSVAIGFTRGEGQDYLAQAKIGMPEGMMADISSVPVLCEEAQANAGTCPAQSQVGTVRTLAGSGTEPLELPAAAEAAGPVYLTKGYGGAPYGLSIVVPAEHVGPYDFGRIVTRAKVEIDPLTARVTVTALPPAIVSGAPLRLRQITLTMDRAGFMQNPTGCAASQTESTLLGTQGLPVRPAVSARLSSSFAASGCGALGFSPRAGAAAGAGSSRSDGASLEFSLTATRGQANLKEVQVVLPRQLSARLSTFNGACREAQAAADILACPDSSIVGSATVGTPLLPDPLSGPAILVSHAGSAFPDVDLVLQGDGVKLIEISHSEIAEDRAISTFPALPDTAIGSLSVKFPAGPHSLLAANGTLCAAGSAGGGRRGLPRAGRAVRLRGRRRRARAHGGHARPASLLMPATLVGQNGARLRETIPVAVLGCASAAGPALKVLSRRVRRGVLYLSIDSARAGLLTVGGRGLGVLRKRLAAGRHELAIELGARGRWAARHHRRLRVRLTLTTAQGSSGVVVAVRP